MPRATVTLVYSVLLMHFPVFFNTADLQYQYGMQVKELVTWSLPIKVPGSRMDILTSLSHSGLYNPFPTNGSVASSCIGKYICNPTLLTHRNSGVFN